MKNNIFSLILTLLVFSPSASYAKDNFARKNTCKLVSALTDKGGKAGANVLIDMFSWREDIMKRAENSLGVVEDFEYIDGAAYIIADFDGLFEQHFLVFTTKDDGNLYFHLNFEKYKNRLRLTNIAFNDSYNELVDKQGSFVQEPEKINC